jgi:DNA excision repair protein ERCC-6
LDNTSREGMIVKIRYYLSQHEGRGTSQDILNNISIDTDQEQIMIFRKMLQTIAKFEKEEATGKGEWVLKKEYQ